MRVLLLLILFISFYATSIAQTSYSGFIDKYPIELVTDTYSDGVVNALYVYTKFDDPIILSGKIKDGSLTLNEKDKAGKITSTLFLKNYNSNPATIEGTWKDLKTGKELKLQLTRNFDLANTSSTDWKDRELLQPLALKNRYFKLVLNYTNSEVTVTGVRVYEKKTDKILQHFAVNVRLWGLNNISVDDYNFDGKEDFSVFEQSYAGPNTSSIYFLYDAESDGYFESSFSGTSLEFDAKAKRIYETNQCCAGRSIEKTEYKVVNNKMVFVKKTCLEYDEKKEDYKTVKCD